MSIIWNLLEFILSSRIISLYLLKILWRQFFLSSSQALRKLFISIRTLAICRMTWHSWFLEIWWVNFLRVKSCGIRPVFLLIHQNTRCHVPKAHNHIQKGNNLKYHCNYSLIQSTSYFFLIPTSFKAFTLPWTNDQFVGDASTWKKAPHSQETNFYAPCGIQSRNSNKRAATSLPLKPRG